MSKEVYESETYMETTPGMMMTMVNDGLRFLTTYTSAIVSDPPGSSDYAYDKLINAGGGMYFRIQLNRNAGYNREQIWIRRGRLVGGEWVEDANITKDNLRSSSIYPCYASLISINGGDIWDLELHFAIGYDNTHGEWEGHLRSVKIESELDSTVYYTGRVYAGDTSDAPFPSSGDGVIVDNTSVGINYVRNSYASMNIPADKFLLFPSLISFNVPCLLGVPTICNQKVYYPSSVIHSYIERVVGGLEYVSLGNVSIRSI